MLKQKLAVFSLEQVQAPAAKFGQVVPKFDQFRSKSDPFGPKLANIAPIRAKVGQSLAQNRSNVAAAARKLLQKCHREISSSLFRTFGNDFPSFLPAARPTESSDDHVFAHFHTTPAARLVGGFAPMFVHVSQGRDLGGCCWFSDIQR